MSDIPEAIGGMAEAALVARAVEPSRGEAATDASGHTTEGTCLNCGTPLKGPHCHGCGQKAHVHRTMRAFLRDLVHGALHFEGKTWRTLPLLALRPGELTRRYIAGERARFVSPMALFLFSVFLMFAVFQLIGLGVPDLDGPSDIGKESAAEQTLEAQLEGLREARAEVGNTSPAAALIDTQIAALERRIEESTDAEGRVVLAEDRESGSRMTFAPTGWAFLDRGIDKWRENPRLMAYKLQTNFYKFSWLLIPLSAPFVWLIFAWRRRFGAYDHAVFVTYSLGFMSLLFIAVALLGQLPGVSGGWLFLATVLIPPLHIYKQLRGAYSLSRFSALWRTMALLFFIAIILTLFLNLLLILGALG